MDLAGLVATLNARGSFARVLNNPLAQSGVPARRYLGATLLPERTVPENSYIEENVRFRTIIANDSTRYSPVQLKQGALSGSVEVKLRDIDTGAEITGQDYDALVKLLTTTGAGGIPTMDATKTLLNFVDRTLNLPLIEKIERQRWQCLVDASVPRTGDDNYAETITYPNPANHRVAAGGSWSNDSYDPFTDIVAMADYAASIGYTINRIVTSSAVVAFLAGNDKVKQRLGRVAISSVGAVTGLPSRVNLTDLNGELANDDLPAIEKYDLQFQTQTGSGYFLKRDVFMMFATTGRDFDLIPATNTDPLVIPNVLGYSAIGRAAGQSTPGRVVRVESFDRKPPRIEGEAWASTLPVLLDPEAVFVIKDIA